MATAWAFIFGCVLCLMFLGMIYGERVSLPLPGSFDGRWVRRGVTGVGDLWSELARALDLMLQFVSDHLSWVVASLAGAAGLSIVAFQMFSGIADDAAAAERDLKQPLHVGGVLDLVPEVDPEQFPPAEYPPDRGDEHPDRSQFLFQPPGGTFVVFNKPDRSFPPPLPDRDELLIPGDLSDREIRRPPGRNRPVLELAFRRIIGLSLLVDDDNSRAVGELIRDWPESAPIDRALERLGRDDWRLSSFDRRTDGSLDGALPRTLPEATSDEVRKLESAVRVLPGDIVAEHDLRIEKICPKISDRAEINVEILVQNVGTAEISGLLVREYLPLGYQSVRRTVPRAVLRHDTLTWLIDDLEPLEERVLKFSIVTDVAGQSGNGSQRFESTTEVSAVTAVSSLTNIAGDDLLDSPIRKIRPRTMIGGDRERPDTSGIFEERDRPTLPEASRRRRILRPDVRMRIEEPPEVVPVDTDATVRFFVSNHGDAPAENVELRVDLDRGIWHHQIGNDDVQRTVTSTVPLLEPGESRTVLLSLRPTRAGRYTSRGATIYQGERISSGTFQIVAEPRRTRAPNRVPNRRNSEATSAR